VAASFATAESRSTGPAGADLAIICGGRPVNLVLLGGQKGYDMMKAVGAIAVVCSMLLAACQTLEHRAAGLPSVKQMSVNDTNLTYLDQGQGVPAVFVHGAVSDHRIWEAQREVVSKHYRFIAIDQRYFGVAPWSDAGTHYSPAIHVADLAEFIRQLNAGPVHLVGRSYGATISLIVAIKHPELVRSLVLNEPPLTSIVDDPEQQKVLSEQRKGLASFTEAEKAGNAVEATRLLLDWVNNQPGGFDQLKSMHLDNARTVLLNAPPLDNPVTCAQLRQLKVPSTLTRGEMTRPFFIVFAETANRCIPGSRLIIIANARHGSPDQNPAAFNDALLSFLARNR
jgi:pimeloyl-ACP methyl ester carboxylesterase